MFRKSDLGEILLANTFYDVLYCLGARWRGCTILDKARGGRTFKQARQSGSFSNSQDTTHYQKQSSEEETRKPAKITNVANTKSDVLFNNDLHVLSGCLHVITGNSLDSAADFGT